MTFPRREATRMLPRLVALMLVVLGLGACSENEPAADVVTAPSSPAVATEPTGPTPPTPTTAPAFAPAKVLIDTDEGSVIIDAEKAETPEQRAIGLMHRTELDADAGMVFLFFEDHSGAFYMKNTLIPLSIAFFGEDGRILDILDMDPCTADPCDLYAPTSADGDPLTYWGALEVNRGAFDEWGVEVGDRITVTH